jgi:hypothetical protein
MKMTEKTEYSTTFIAYFCGVAALLREAVKEADAAVEFEAELIKINAAAEKRPARPAEYDKLNGVYDFRDRLEKLYVIAEAFKERYGIKSDYSGED